jgi:hypothetical protein
MAVSGFKDQLAGGSSPLRPEQEQQLTRAMSEERSNFKFTTDFSDKSKFTGDFGTMFTEEKINQYFEEQNRLNEQYLNRAQGILSADQVGPFQKYLTSQQELQKAGMQMAQKMFAPSGEGK